MFSVFGKPTMSKLWSKTLPKARLCNVLGKLTMSKLWSKTLRKVKLYKILGKLRLSKLWSKSLPTVRLYKVLNKLTLSCELARYMQSSITNAEGIFQTMDKAALRENVKSSDSDQSCHRR